MTCAKRNTCVLFSATCTYQLCISPCFTHESYQAYRNASNNELFTCNLVQCRKMRDLPLLLCTCNRSLDFCAKFQDQLLENSHSYITTSVWYLYTTSVWYFRWLLYLKTDFYKIIFILSWIINPSLKSENPATCLCTIALFRCVHPAPLRTLREVHVLENA